MYTPHTYFVALILVIISMLCWGSWANLSKALPKWRFEYFYLDFTLGFLLLVTVLGATLGSAGSPGFGFFARLSGAARSQVAFALLGGFLWNLGNLLLLASIMLVGMAIAFPVTSVIAMILGVAISYWTQPIGNPVWLTAGVVVLVVAVIDQRGGLSLPPPILRHQQTQGRREVWRSSQASSLVASLLLWHEPSVGPRHWIPTRFHFTSWSAPCRRQLCSSRSCLHIL